jgi:phosphoribosylamine---glycine ligase
VGRNVLIVGGGGREHALALAARRDGHTVICAPGNAGIARDVEVADVGTDDHAGLVALATSRGVDLVIVGPEAPLVAGLADVLRSAGVRVFGPSGAAARLEGSKAFAKEIMSAAGVPTAAYATVTDVAHGMAVVARLGLPVAIKADGLAAGKGVVVAHDETEARDALTACLDSRAFGDAGASVVVEEGMTGPEVSLLAFSDGTRIVRLPPARDYKPIGEGNTGPNTGGMGSVSPPADVSDELADAIVQMVHRPVIDEMARRGTPFTGVLYAGLMLTPQGPKVIEFNCRFGDPETQCLLPRVDEDLIEVLTAAADGALEERPLRLSDDPCVAVVLAAHNYPGTPRAGDAITGLDEASSTGAQVLHAGTAADADGNIVTAGGRVLAVAARGPDIATARARAYAGADLIHFDGRQLRRDIGA